MDILLSIIIPIYNVEKYLRQCIDSVLYQLQDNVEIICINDGSTDSSLLIVDSYAQKDSRVVVIDKQNSGYGDSVNQGILASKGKYIAILESDDFAVEGIYNKLLDIALEYDADIVKGNYYNYNSKTKAKDYFENLKKFPYMELLNIKEYTELFFVGPSIWSGIYKRSFLVDNDIFFLPTPGASYQDTSFAFKTWACTDRIVLVNEPVIYYRQDNIDSSSNNCNKVFDIFRETEEMTDFLNKHLLACYMPECMVAKFRSMKWSLDRLNGQSKLLFLLKMHLDLQRDCINGFMKEELWSPYDWMIVNNIIFNINYFADKMVQGLESTCSIENVIRIIARIDRVYIYNTDYYAGKLYGEMVENGVYPTGFLSDGEIVGITNTVIPGKAIVIDSALRDEGIILINSNDPYIDGLMNKLDQNNIRNYLLVNIKKVW